MTRAECIPAIVTPGERQSEEWRHGPRTFPDGA